LEELASLQYNDLLPPAASGGTAVASKAESTTDALSSGANVQIRRARSNDVSGERTKSTVKASSSEKVDKVAAL
jgi:hypothetical protein